MKCKICGKYFNGDSEYLSTCTPCYHEYHESKEELEGTEPEPEPEGEEEDEN